MNLPFESVCHVAGVGFDWHPSLVAQVVLCHDNISAACMFATNIGEGVVS